MAARLWTCDVCGKQEPWSKTWAWWGSYAIQENCGHVVALCSEQCKRKSEVLVAEFDAAHPPYGHRRVCTWKGFAK